MKWIKWILFLIALYPLCRFCHHQTGGFSMAKIRDNTCVMKTESECPFLSKEFHYLGRGLQSFSFVSTDGELVLKIFNNRYQQKLFWYRFLPFTKERRESAKTKLERNFRSYKIAFEELAQETKVLYFHPSKTKNLCPTITLVDKLGIKHPLDLNNVGFIVQKKAILFYPHIEELMKKKELFKAKEALQGFVQLLKSRFEKGIGNNDPLVRTNFGFVGDSPIYIDVGPFYRDESLKTNYKHELIQSTLNLKHWLEERHPPLATYFDELIKTL